MIITKKRILLSCEMCIVLVTYGCGLKPVPRIPGDISIPQVLEVVEKNSDRIRDFSGTAFVNAKMKGEPPQNALVTIQYIRPDRFKVIIKGFAGIVLAIISTNNDLPTIYFPSENAYITFGNDENIDRFLMSEIGVDFKQITSLLTGTLPPSKEREFYQMTLENHGNKAELMLKRDGIIHRYTLEGPDLRVIDENVSHNGVQIWHMWALNFSVVNGIPFPRKISVENEHGVMDIEFSKYSINPGLAENDISFVIPPSAKRMVIYEPGNI